MREFEAFHVPSDIYENLEPFWHRWGHMLQPVTFQLPDFSSSNWKYQMKQEEVGGENMPVPYYKIPREEQSIDILKDLVQHAKNAGVGIIVEVGSASSLSPLTSAQANEGSIVIALDVWSGPPEKYPSEVKYPSNEYPYVAKAIYDNPMKRSAAFFFPYSVKEVQHALRESAWRVQLVAPDPEIDRGLELLRLVLQSADLVGPGGELLVTGDGFLSDKMWFEGRFDPNSYRTDSKVYTDMKILRNGFNEFGVYDLRGMDLYRHFGIADSGWFYTIHDAFYKESSSFSYNPGVAIFHGKK